VTSTGPTRGRSYPLLYRTVDYHTAGEPFRIVVDGVAPPPGVTVADRRLAALRGEDGGAADRARRLLSAEPRGHADMYGCFVVPPDPVPAGTRRAEPVRRAELGVLFWHRDGFSTACGHGTIALATWAVDDGLVDAPDDGAACFGIDVPSGRVEVEVRRAAGRVVDVTFSNVAAWVSAPAVIVPTEAGVVQVSVSFGGAFYAGVRAPDLGLAVRPEHLPRIVELSRQIRAWFERDPAAVAAVTHLQDPRLSGLYGCVWYEDVADPAVGPVDPAVLHQRNVTVFADGAVDRSPCGSGTSARLAVLRADGFGPGRVLWHDSLVGTRFEAWLGTDRPDGVATHVRGSAYRTGQHTFVLDPADPLAEGFSLVSGAWSPGTPRSGRSRS
jgi:proline racemase/trans-L-3-hydroxyproline dehydratase